MSARATYTKNYEWCVLQFDEHEDVENLFFHETAAEMIADYNDRSTDTDWKWGCELVRDTWRDDGMLENREHAEIDITNWTLPADGFNGAPVPKYITKQLEEARGAA